METRHLFPLSVLGLLGILTAGAIALGLVQAPPAPTADTVVHDGGASLVAASSFTIEYTATSTVGSPVRIEFDYTSPDHMTAYRIVNGSRERHLLTAAQVQGALVEFSIARLKGFKKEGTSFVLTEPATRVYPAATRRQITGGTARFVVTVRTEFLVEDQEFVHVRTAEVARSTHIDLKVTRIAGQPAPGR